MASVILLLAPEQSIDRNPLNLAVAGVILSACGLYPILMVIRMNHRSEKEQFVT